MSTIEAHRVDDRRQVPDPACETQIFDVPVGRPHTAMVVEDHPPSEVGQAIRHVPEDRASTAITRRIAKDIGREDKRRAVAHAHVGDANAVAGRGIVQWPEVRRHNAEILCRVKLAADLRSAFGSA
jgi:hypothetical protein